MSFPTYPAYKDSGVEWLGEVPEHWEVLPLKHFAEVDNSGCYGVEPADGDHIRPVATTAQIDSEGRFDVGRMSDRGFSAQELARYECSPGDVLVVKSSGSAENIISGKAGLVREDTPAFVFSNFLMRLRHRKDVCLPPFLYSLLISHLTRERIKQMCSTTTYPNLQVGLYTSAKLPCPPLSEQTQIARFLDHETARIDALIEEQQRLIELLKEKRQAVISHAVTKGLDPTVPMKDSGVEWLGEVPAHWRAVRLRHCLVDALTYGANEPSDEANLEHPRYIRITDLNDDGTLSAETYKSLPPEKAGPYMLEEGDVLFARSGATVGKSFLYSREYGPACYAGYLIRARVNKRALIPMYLWMCTQSRQYEQFIGESNIQATIQNISAEKYGNMWIALPEIEEQEKILVELEIKLSQFKSLMETSVGALVLLQERRSALISATVTGKIDVRGWQPPASAQTTELEKEAN